MRSPPEKLYNILVFPDILKSIIENLNKVEISDLKLSCLSNFSDI